MTTPDPTADHLFRGREGHGRPGAPRQLLSGVGTAGVDASVDATGDHPACTKTDCSRTKTQLQFFIAADLAANGLDRWRSRYRISHRLAYFQWLLRRCEYWDHRSGPIAFAMRKVLSVRLVFLGERLGVSVPRHVIGPGLRIAHGGAVVISPLARIGRNFCIHQGVTIGQVGSAAPQIGDNVWIGSGAQVLGEVTVSAAVAVGANAVVIDDVRPGVTVAGVPAHVVSAQSSALWLRGDASEIARQRIASRTKRRHRSALAAGDASATR